MTYKTAFELAEMFLGNRSQAWLTKKQGDWFRSVWAYTSKDKKYEFNKIYKYVDCGGASSIEVKKIEIKDVKLAKMVEDIEKAWKLDHMPANNEYYIILPSGSKNYAYANKLEGMRLGDELIYIAGSGFYQEEQ